MLSLASHADLAEDIERAEVEHFRELIRKTAAECIGGGGGGGGGGVGGGGGGAAVGGSTSAAAVAATLNLEVDPLGGFRRGKAASHDMDFMVTYDGLLNPHPLLHAMVAKLHTLSVGPANKALPFVVHSTKATKKKRCIGKELVNHFIMTTGYGKDSSRGGKKNYTFDGHSRVFMIVRSDVPPYKKRRLDLIVVAKWQHAYAKLSWTGSVLYNRQLRHYAKQHGYGLNAHGMIPYNANNSGILKLMSEQKEDPVLNNNFEHLHASLFKDPYLEHDSDVDEEDSEEMKSLALDFVQAKTEKDILDALGLPYLHPEMRNF